MAAGKGGGSRMIDTILMYLNFAYVRYALIVGVLIAL